MSNGLVQSISEAGWPGRVEYRGSTSISVTLLVSVQVLPPDVVFVPFPAVKLECFRYWRVNFGIEFFNNNFVNQNYCVNIGTKLINVYIMHTAECSGRAFL